MVKTAFGEFFAEEIEEFSDGFDVFGSVDITFMLGHMLSLPP